MLQADVPVSREEKGGQRELGPVLGLEPARRSWQPRRARAGLVSRAEKAILVAWAVLVPIVAVPVPGLGLTGAADLLGLFAIGLIVARRKLPGYLLAFFLFIGWSAISAIIGDIARGEPDSLDVILNLTRLVAITAPACVVAGARTVTADDIHKLLRTVALFTTIGVAVGVVLHLAGIVVGDPQRLWVGDGLGGTARAGGLVGNSGTFGALAAFSFVVVQFSVLGSGIGLRVLKLSNVAVCALALILSSSRGGLVFVLAAVAAWSMWRVATGVVRLCIAVGVGVVALQFLGSGNAFIASSIQRLDILNLGGGSSFGSSIRSSLLRQAWSDFGDSPVAGTGYKQFLDTAGYLVDSSFLLILVETGVIGLAFFLLFWFGFGVESFKASVSANACGRPPLAFPLFVGFSARMMTGGAFSQWYVAPLVYLTVAALIRLERDVGAQR